MVPNFCSRIGTVQQQRGAILGGAQDIVGAEKLELMYGNEIRALDQIGAVNGTIAEAQVRHRHRARLFRVVNKIALGVIRSLFTNYLDRVFVCADRAISTEPPEQCAHLVFRFSIEIWIIWQAGVCYVVVDPDREMVLGFLVFQLVKHTLTHRRGKLLRRQAISSTNNARHPE